MCQRDSRYVPDRPEVYTESSALIDLDAQSPVLVIAFGGLAMQIAAGPPFELFRMLSRYADVKKMFVRDRFRSWFHCGVRGMADSIDGIAASLRCVVSESQAKKVVMLGTSAGTTGGS